MVQSAAPSDTSACVRIPAGLPRTSRSIPIPLPMAAAASNRSTSSEVSGGRSAMRGDCRSQAGRAAGAVPEEDDFDAVRVNAVEQVIADPPQRQDANVLAGTRAPRPPGVRRAHEQLASTVDVFVECFGRLVAISEPPAARGID